jgi:hypothetical protein
MAGFIDTVLTYFDRHLTQDGVRRFLVSEYQTFIEGHSAPEDLYSNLERVGALLAKLGWIEMGNQKILDEIKLISSHIDAAERWLEKLYGSHVVSQGVVMVGAGENLDILDSHNTREDFVRSEADRLLRHVENRRRKSLGQFSESLDQQENFKEKTEIAVFFNRYAQRHNDLRFLNAAFKLNEWLMIDYRKVQDSQLRTAFLLALAEQEISAQELLK